MYWCNNRLHSYNKSRQSLLPSSNSFSLRRTKLRHQARPSTSLWTAILAQVPRSLGSRSSRTLLHPSGRLYAGVSALAPSNRLFLRLSSPPPDHPYKKGRSNRPPPAPLAPVGSFRRVWAVRLSDSPRKSGDWGLQAGCFRNGLFSHTPTTLLDKAFRPLLPQLFGSPGGRYGQVNPVASCGGQPSNCRV